MMYIGYCKGCDHVWRVRKLDAECPKCHGSLEIESVHT